MDLVESRRLAQIEKKLNEIGSASRGQREFHAERLSDVLDQIDELRTELQRIAARQDKIAEYVKQHLPRQADDETTASN